MEPTDFSFAVLPLVVLIGILVSLAFYYGEKEERHKKKLVKTIRTYVRYRLKQEKIFAKELENLQTLLRNKSIDKKTYKRLKETLESSIAQQREEARTQLEQINLVN